MNRKEKALFALVLVGSFTYAAWAANDTIGVTVGSGKVANLIKFASTNVIGEIGICDSSTENQCAGVSAAGALSVDGSAVTQPVSVGTLPLPTGAATSALQGTNTATTAHTCSTGGYSQLGCLGQINDSINSPIPTQGGTVIIGGVGIDQTTPGTTNAISIANSSVAGTAGTTAVAGTSSSSVVAKASAGNLQNAYVTSSSAGWVFIINATSLPSNATLTIGTASGNLQGCFELQKGVSDWGASINYNPGPWEHFSTGIVVAISSTDCPVLTAAATGKFLHSQAN